MFFGLQRKRIRSCFGGQSVSRVDLLAVPTWLTAIMKARRLPVDCFMCREDTGIGRWGL